MSKLKVQTKFKFQSSNVKLEKYFGILTFVIDLTFGF
jgi:hypothetical protein